LDTLSCLKHAKMSY